MTVLYILISTVDLTYKDELGALGSKKKMTRPVPFTPSPQIALDKKILGRQIRREKGQIFWKGSQPSVLILFNSQASDHVL